MALGAADPCFGDKGEVALSTWNLGTPRRDLTRCQHKAGILASHTHSSNSNSSPQTPATSSKMSFSCCRLSTIKLQAHQLPSCRLLPCPDPTAWGSYSPFTAGT
ncbi:hypothetical protein Celaphus_00006280 [Cervus elaphus hippelaphus]|uniref:Uncharacterized protein n=1 Tax=Cervus elaphus hippelaphus TaxID=46360 RepID=A0A212CUG3_CEREH|nr:hypothetical protein Celaphus_00006280 [Cervus elaphus hippelaphus]